MFRMSEDRPPVLGCSYCGDIVEVHLLEEIDTQLFCEGCAEAIWGDHIEHEVVSERREVTVK